MLTTRRRRTKTNAAAGDIGSVDTAFMRQADSNEHAKSVEQSSIGLVTPTSITSTRRTVERDETMAEASTSTPRQQSTNTRTRLIMARPLPVRAFMVILAVIVQLYTWTTLPLAILLQWPWRQLQLDRKRRTVARPAGELHRLPDPEEESLCSDVYERIEGPFVAHPVICLDTITEMLDTVVATHGPNTRALGYRRVISEEDALDEQGNIKRIDGRSLKKYHLNDYSWMTYKETDDFTSNVAQQLMSMGVTSESRVLIISETRFEWMLAAQSIVRTGASIVTLFSNLGLDGVHHGITETQVQTVIASIDCLDLLSRALAKGGHAVVRVIYFDGYKTPNLASLSSYEIAKFSEVETAGRERVERNVGVTPLFKATPDHPMLVMYTSGTTGTPKGVTLTHRQFAASMNSLIVLITSVIDTASEHTYIAYLPMAHVLELTVELFLFFGGVRIGYGSPFTLTNSAPGLAKGVSCDMQLLAPTVMTSVPLVLDRILKEISDKLRSRTPVSEPLFSYLMAYKSVWTQRGFTCPITRSLLCSKVRDQLGGGLKYMICGGAPLSAKTQATIKAALDVTLIQGYGATETTGAAMCMDFDDLSYGLVGVPLGGVKLRLKDWQEGGYYRTDKPCPRGEILIGGDCITVGYFNLDGENREAFVVDASGCRWFRTGDIGQIETNGSVKIIDRRKDLIKLQNGEYISLGKVESALKASQYIDNICVYGGALSNDLVALITPNRKSLDLLAAKLQKEHLTVRELCDDPTVEDVILQDLRIVGKDTKLGKKELPVRIRLVSEEWSPDNGILTAALKLKRKAIESVYSKELTELYSPRSRCSPSIVIDKQLGDTNSSTLSTIDVNNNSASIVSSNKQISVDDAFENNKHTNGHTLAHHDVSPTHTHGRNISIIENHSTVQSV